MADPLLTSLCGICHISTPKYKCPRCGTRTCSLACIKKHKAWSECTGERDATAYVAPSKLRTPAGVDHDYNFLHGIERSVERAEKLLVEERGIVQEEELRPLTVQEVKWKPGRDGRKRKVLVTRLLREAKGRTFERFLAARLKKLNITIMCAPMGMARQKENHTTLNRRTNRINWQVEWMAFEDVPNAEPNKVRILSKVMDDVPLYEAYHTMLEEQQRVKGQQTKKIPRTGLDGQVQDSANSTWSSGSFALQDPFTGAWTSHHDTEPGMWPSEKLQTRKRQFQFFLAKFRTPSDKPSVVTKLNPEDCLRAILRDTRVLEFPTIWVLNQDQSLPTSFTLGSKDIVPPQEGNKRKNPPGKKGPGKPSKRRNRGKDVEEGEIRSDEEGDQSDDGINAGVRGVTLEAGDVVAEQSFGEEDDDDDDTSSSGSDSESD
ncbi:Box C/D snoRNA protein 1 [Fusarium austroafricanum]|uniref:Box C/D snoRNA protein 1 n=1 Tax=Fusarium austroafricanum TaxID=2364996 RepID=A0A8H4K837_9HYPO|nr:Box C/D snoRNA protein 1 [Fusarium austroafricanum]